MSAPAARLAGVGLFVIAGLVLFAIGLFMIGDRQMAFARKFVVYTEFAKIPGLGPGAIVRVSGAKAGSVTEIIPPGKPSEKFRVKMEVAEELHPLVRTDSVAAIEIEGLVGGTFLSIGTGTDRAPRAPENSTIPSREPFAITDLLQQMSDTITNVNQTIDDLKGDVERAVIGIGDTVDNANELITSVSDDIKTMASAGARISGDAAEIADSIRQGKGTVGKLVNDDELYRRAVGIAKQGEEIATNTREVVEQAKQIASNAREVMEQAKQAVIKLQAKDGPVQGVAANVKQTLDDARIAMAGFAENMEALKHNFFFRGYFNRRGYFSLAELSPVEYQQGVLTHGGDRRMLRVWLKVDVLFAPADDGGERLTDDGKARLESAIAPYLDQINSAVVIVEGYAQAGTVDEQYLRSRARAGMARDHLIGRFALDPQNTGAMPLGSKSTGSPDNTPWEGVAIAVFVDKELLAPGK
jgi:phospholipid/cholesterol/gamma-HCH transport system substrate-binding protein